MKEKVLIKQNTYADSVTLMSLSQKVQDLPGIGAAMVGMATPLNLELLQNLNFGENLAAQSSDLIIAVRADNEADLEIAIAKVDELLNKKNEKKGNAVEQVPLVSLDQALEIQDSNLVLISLPGAYAAKEARKALDKNLHVMLFSDNVRIEDEVALKKTAHEKGLLVMGPDCGTAIINGVPLAFANKVSRGVIGVVGASGTGTQEVTVQIDRMGQGISQAIGTGGRDLKEAVGAIMMLDAIEALKQDIDTEVIAVLSKPASPEVTQQVFRSLDECGKPSVLYVIGSKKQIQGSKNVRIAGSLLETAQIAVELAKGVPLPKQGADRILLQNLSKELKPDQKYIRGLYSGGTLCDEAMEVLTDKAGLIYSNGPLDPIGQLDNPNKSVKNTVLDLGDDFFTVGRPHPMIDFSLRMQRLEQEARDPEVAIILMDIVLGYGSNSDPASEVVKAIKKAKQAAEKEGRKQIYIAYVCGTPSDPQGYVHQKEALSDAGIILFDSNVEAAEFAGLLLETLNGGV